MIVNDIVQSQKYLEMDKVLGKFVWSQENSEFKEITGCFQDEPDLTKFKDVCCDCILVVVHYLR